jgi:hypothetical protein
MSSKLIASVAALAVTSLVSSGVASISASNGNATLTLTGGSGFSGLSAAFSSAPGSPGQTADLLLDPATADVLARFEWFVRTPSFNQNIGLNSLPEINGTTSSGTIAVAGTNSGPTVSPGGTDRYDFVVTTRLTDGSTPGVGTVVSTVTITSNAGNAAGTRAFQLFNQYSPNVSGSGSAADTVLLNANSGLAKATFTDGSTSDYAEYVAQSPTFFNVGSANLIGTGAANVLLSPVNTGASGAQTYAASQWTFNLAAGQSATASVAFSYNVAAAIPEPTALLGLAALPMVLRRRSK